MNDTESLTEILKKHNIDYIETKYLDEIIKSENVDKELFLYGTIGLNKLAKNTKWQYYCNFPQYRCSYYYPIFGIDLINRHYCILPYGDLHRRQPWIYETFGEDKTIFIRPDAGNKIFPGQIIYKENFYKDINNIAPYINHDELCLISKPKNINTEYRLFTDGKNVLSGCCYKRDGKLVEEELPDRIKMWAECVLVNQNYQPDPIFCVDVCEVNGILYFLEFNSFSAAGFYSTPLDPILDYWKECCG